MQLQSFECKDVGSLVDVVKYIRRVAEGVCHCRWILVLDMSHLNLGR